MEGKDRSIADPGVCCVVVNWNGWGDTLDCLASLREQEYGNLTIVVVDNGSTDDSDETENILEEIAPALESDSDSDPDGSAAAGNQKPLPAECSGYSRDGAVDGRAAVLVMAAHDSPDARPLFQESKRCLGDRIVV